MLNVEINKQYLIDQHAYDENRTPVKYTDAQLALICKYARYRINYITDDAEQDDTLTLSQIEKMKEAMAILAMHWINNGWDTTRVSGSGSAGGFSASSSNPQDPAYIPHLVLEILSSAGLYDPLLPSSPSPKGIGCGPCDHGSINQLPSNWMSLIDNYMAGRLNAKENLIKIPEDAKTEDYMAIWNQHGRFLVTLDQMATKLSPDKGLFTDTSAVLTSADLLTKYDTGITVLKGGVVTTFQKGGVNELKVGDQIRVEDKNGIKTYTFSAKNTFIEGLAAVKPGLDPDEDYTIGTETKKIKEWFALWNEKQDKIASTATQTLLTALGYKADAPTSVKGDFSVEDIMLWLGNQGFDVEKDYTIGVVTKKYKEWFEIFSKKQDALASLATQTALQVNGYAPDVPNGIQGDNTVEDILKWLSTKGGDFDQTFKGVTKTISEWVEQNKDDIQILSSPLKFKEYANIAAAVTDKGTTGFDNPSLILIKGDVTHPPKIYIAKEKDAFTDETKWTEIPLTLKTHVNENGEPGWLITDVQIASDKLLEHQLLSKLREIEKGNLVAGLGDFELVNAEQLAWVLKQVDQLKFKDNKAGETGPKVQDTAIATSNSAGTTQMTLDEYLTEISKTTPDKWGQHELAKMIHVKGAFELLKVGMKPVDLDDKAAFDKAFNDAKDGTPIFGIVRDLAGFPATVFADGQTHTGIGIVYLNKAVGVSLDDVKVWIPGGGGSSSTSYIDWTAINLADLTKKNVADELTGDLVGWSEFDTKDGHSGTFIASKGVKAGEKIVTMRIFAKDGEGFHTYTFKIDGSNGTDHVLDGSEFNWSDKDIHELKSQQAIANANSNEHTWLYDVMKDPDATSSTGGVDDEFKGYKRIIYTNYSKVVAGIQGADGRDIRLANNQNCEVITCNYLQKDKDVQANKMKRWIPVGEIDISKAKHADIPVKGTWFIGDYNNVGATNYQTGYGTPAAEFPSDFTKALALIKKDAEILFGPKRGYHNYNNVEGRLYSSTYLTLDNKPINPSTWTIATQAADPDLTNGTDLGVSHASRTYQGRANFIKVKAQRTETNKVTIFMKAFDENSSYNNEWARIIVPVVFEEGYQTPDLAGDNVSLEARVHALEAGGAVGAGTFKVTGSDGIKATTSTVGTDVTTNVKLDTNTQQVLTQARADHTKIGVLEGKVTALETGGGTGGGTGTTYTASNGVTLVGSDFQLDSTTKQTLTKANAIPTVPAGQSVLVGTTETLTLHFDDGTTEQIKVIK